MTVMLETIQETREVGRYGILVPHQSRPRGYNVIQWRAVAGDSEILSMLDDASYVLEADSLPELHAQILEAKRLRRHQSEHLISAYKQVWDLPGVRLDFKASEDWVALVKEAEAHFGVCIRLERGEGFSWDLSDPLACQVVQWLWSGKHNQGVAEPDRISMLQMGNTILKSQLDRLNSGEAAVQTLQRQDPGPITVKREIVEKLYRVSRELLWESSMPPLPSSPALIHMAEAVNKIACSVDSGDDWPDLCEALEELCAP